MSMWLKLGKNEKSMTKIFPTHGLSKWMIIQIFYVDINYMSTNLLDLAIGGIIMATTLQIAIRLLHEITSNYTQWYTERAPTGKKVKFVGEISSLNDKIDMLFYACF